MLRQSLNQVTIKGKLEEVDLTKQTDKQGRDYIRGTVTLLVDQTVDGVSEQTHPQVNVFAYKITNKGTENPAYKSASELMQNGVSIAACGSVEGADVYTVSGAGLATNTFENKDHKDVTYTFIRGSFFNKNGKGEPCAIFEQEIIISGIEDEVKDDLPTGRLMIKGISIGYNEVPDMFTYFVENQNAIDYIRSNWQEEDTVKISGVIRYKVESQEIAVEEEVGFGEPVTKVYDKTIKEFVITAGSAGRLPEDKCYDIEEVLQAGALKKANYEKRKAAQTQNQASQSSSASRLRGF